MSGQPDEFWAIEDPPTGRVWGPDGWMMPPGNACTYDTLDEALRDLTAVKEGTPTAVAQQYLAKD